MNTFPLPPSQREGDREAVEGVCHTPPVCFAALPPLRGGQAGL